MVVLLKCSFMHSYLKQFAVQNLDAPLRSLNYCTRSIGDDESCYDRATREHFEKRNAGKDAKLEGSFAAGGSSSAPKAKLGDAAANKLLADAGQAAIKAAAAGMKTHMYPPAESHYMVINWRGRSHSTPTSM